MRGVVSAIIGTGSKFMPLPSVHAYGTNTGRILFVHDQNYVCMFCEHVLFMDDHAY